MELALAHLVRNAAVRKLIRIQQEPRDRLHFKAVPAGLGTQGRQLSTQPPEPPKPAPQRNLRGPNVIGQRRPPTAAL